MSNKPNNVSLQEHLWLVFLCVMAFAQFCYVEAELNSTTTLIAWMIIQIGLVLGGTFYFRSISTRCEEQPVLLPVLVIVGLVSVASEPLLRHFYDTGSAFEVVLIRALKNVMLLLAMACCWKQYHPLTVVVSLFVFLYSVALSPLTFIVMSLYLSTATFWLFRSYLQRYSTAIAASNQRVSLKRFQLLAIIPAVIILSFGHFTSPKSIWTLQGFLPTSGGDGASDTYAMEGIGNGDALVAGKENVQTFAPIDDAPFRETDKPSLYDSFSESYGEPFLPKNSDRTIALSPDQSKSSLEELKEEMKIMQQSGREFSTLRKETAEKRTDIESTTSKAIFHVVGRVPLHLRMETYDFYDGVSLIPSSKSEGPISYELKKHEKFHWLEAIENAAYDCFSAEESHVLKIVGVDTNIVPTPLHWTGIAIKDLDKRNFYESGQYRIIHLDRNKLPDLVPMHFRSRVLDERYFESDKVLCSGFLPHLINLPDSDKMKPISRLANRITANVNRRIERISEITKYMRENYKLGSSSSSGTEKEMQKTDLSVSRFLFETKTGTDYEFAISTMLLLRSLNISARVVSGYYVDPEEYDYQKGHTSVYQDDVHFWCEVYLGGNLWDTVEPTPGYEKLAPPLSVFEHIQHAVLAILYWAKKHLVLLGALIFLAGVIYWQRRSLLAYAYFGIWHAYCRWLKLTSNKQEMGILATRKLLDRFFFLSGTKRPNGIPLRKWMFEHFSLLDDEKQLLVRFLATHDHISYGSSSLSDSTQDDLVSLCQKTILHFNWMRFRQL